MKKLLVTTMLLFSFVIQAQSHFSYSRNGKMEAFAVSAATSAITYTLMKGKPEHTKKLVSIGAGILVGVIKEMIEQNSRFGGFSIQDAMYGSYGAAFATATINLFDKNRDRTKRRNRFF